MLYKQVGKPRGLERGVRGSLARHNDQYGWAAKNAREREELELKEKELAARLAALKLKEQELVQREAQAVYIKQFHQQALEILHAESPSTIKQVQKLEELRGRLKRLDDMIRSGDNAKLNEYRTRILESDRKAAEMKDKDSWSY